MKKKENHSSPKTQRMKRQRKIRRDAIIGEAEKSFIEKGYNDTTVDQIALDAGYTKASIYNYFESKDDMFAAVLAKIYERMYEIFDKFFKEQGSNIRLRDTGDAHFKFINNYPGQAELLDSGRCTIISRGILEKEEKGQELTESETEYKQGEAKVGMLLIEIIKKTLKKYGVEEKVSPLKVIKALAALNPVILSIIKTGKSVGQTDEQIEQTLSVLFNIIEQGVKNYEEL